MVGLGNSGVTPDALGPQVVGRTLATRHLGDELARQIGLDSLRKTAAIAPGVMGQTGIETGEIVLALVNFIRPAAVISIDALAAQDYSRLGSTIQIANTGISPGSGVQNSRKELSERTLGVPVISVGVPPSSTAPPWPPQSPARTAAKSTRKLARAMVTPREVDRMIGHAAKFILVGSQQGPLPAALAGGDLLPLCA